MDAPNSRRKVAGMDTGMMSGKLRQAARKFADSSLAAATPLRWVVQVRTVTNRETTGLVEVERVGMPGQGLFWIQVRNSVYLADDDLIWIVKDTAAQGNWIFAGFVEGGGTGESGANSPIPSVSTPVVTSPAGTSLTIRSPAGEVMTVGRINETVICAGGLSVAQGLTIGGLGAGYVKSSAGGVLSVATEVPLIDLGSYTQGDLIYGGAADWQDLAHPGVADRVLQSTAAEVGWSANAVTFPTAGAVPVGTGGANQVAYWTAASTLAGHTGFLYDGASHAAIGTALNANFALKVNKDIGVAASYGIQSIVNCNNAGANAIYNMGYLGGIEITGAGNLTSALGQTGVWADITHRSASVVTRTQSLIARAVFVGAGATGSITTHYGLYMYDAFNSGATGSMGTQYGIYIENLNFATTNWAIYSLGGNSYHTGRFAVGGTVAPLAQLHVDQPCLSGAIPVVIIDQADTSEGTINFIASDRGVITGATNSLASVRVEIGGVVHRLALYVDA